MARAFLMGDLARHFGLSTTIMRRVVARMGLETPRLGICRIFFAEDLPKIERELRRRGYLPEKEGASA